MIAFDERMTESTAGILSVVKNLFTKYKKDVRFFYTNREKGSLKSNRHQSQGFAP